MVLLVLKLHKMHTFTRIFSFKNNVWLSQTKSSPTLDLRLKNLAILSIEQNKTNYLNFDSIIHDFSNMKVRKINV